MKIVLCVPAYGKQEDEWWAPLIQEAAQLYKHGIELLSVQSTQAMMTDVARNDLARRFLEKDADWSFWVDTDNIHKLGGLERLLQTAQGRTLVTGIYLKRKDTPEPVVYFKLPDGRYETLGDHRAGQIIPVDAAGLGGCLIHRSVFEDIEKNYAALQRASGGYIAVHKDDILGDIFDDVQDARDGKVIDGVLRDRLYMPASPVRVPFFELGYQRTEDYGFFEKAKRLGHQLWCDTGAEIGHLDITVREPAAFHEWTRK